MTHCDSVANSNSIELEVVPPDLAIPVLTLLRQNSGET